MYVLLMTAVNPPSVQDINVALEREQGSTGMSTAELKTGHMPFISQSAQSTDRGDFVKSVESFLAL